MQSHAQPRYKKRVPCRMRVGESRYSGVVLNISGSGLFVQTSAAAEPGHPVEIELGGEVAVSGQVVWQRRIPTHLRSLVEGGLGVRISSAPERYYELVAAAAAGRPLATASPKPEAKASAPKPETAASPPERGAARNLRFRPRPARRRAEPPPQRRAAPVRQPAEPPPGPVEPHDEKFRVRLKQSQGPRSRVIDLEASSRKDAEGEALERAGTGWIVLEIERRS